MKDLFDKLGSYNIFNHLFPGVLFAVFVDAATSLKILQKEIIVGVFVYYFLGVVVSRIGSLMLEPLLKRLGFLEFVPYAEFLKASKDDQKIDVLSETNNMYRTLSSLMLSVAFVIIYDRAAKHFSFLSDYAIAIAIAFLGMLFLVSYRKQTAYIVGRIGANKS